MRNVSHLVLRPPGHTGKAKKGHLIFDAAFESGKKRSADRVFVLQSLVKRLVV